MQKFLETLNNTVKLISSLATLSVLGAVVYFGLKAYHTVDELTSKPIQMPSVKLPAIEVPPIKVAMPEIKLPEVKLPEIMRREPRPPEGDPNDPMTKAVLDLGYRYE